MIKPSTVCGLLKSCDIIVWALYMPYQMITNPNPSFTGDANNIANIPASLQGYAPPGLFVIANTARSACPIANDSATL
ncbi:hypothetical protein [Bradyrhizobium erythrophlei]|uniref:Uncharacterized protein n=1 Tax=Bradyrhizobium erythrophlei TaxID=1437360 RepID=A0A1H4Y2R6_9BRAD|nr:hypothetical protein [Bradyrhizobium erythrophlei]SED11368.1 hypothetical protein SAMN05444164_3733 [Bradyrhizobium erythrophlei]